MALGGYVRDIVSETDSQVVIVVPLAPAASNVDVVLTSTLGARVHASVGGWTLLQLGTVVQVSPSAGQI
jgi:hypothetical protein